MKILNTLTRRLMLWFVLVGLLPLVLVGYSTQRDNEQTLREESLKNLAQLADKKSLQIRGYMNERIADTRLIARSGVTQEAVIQLSQRFQSGHTSIPAYREADARFRGYFERYIDDATMFYDVFLINLQGDIVYSQRHERDFATNLMVGPYRDTGLSDAFLESRLTLESVASTYEYYQPSQAMAAFVAMPVIRDDRLLGVIAFQLGIAQIQQVAADPIGLGSSGETVLAKLIDAQHAMILTQTKYDFEAILKPVGFGKIPDPMHRALLGISGSGIEYDYRNRQVIAAWRYLPDLRVGMVVKMDADEAFASLHQQRVFSMTALLLAVLFASGAAFYFGRKLVVPLRELAGGSEDVARGNLDRRVNEQGDDEIGLLGRAFNRMAENLQASHSLLEQRVEQRTEELNRSLEELRVKDAAIASSINAIAIADMQGKIFYVNRAFVELWKLHGPEYAIGHVPSEFVENPEAVREVLETLQRQGYWRGELRALRHDGSGADLSVATHLVMDAVGKPVCMMASFVDITERKEAEQRAQTNEQKFRSIIDASPVPNALNDERGNITFLNPAFVQTFGYTLQDIPALVEWWPKAYPDPVYRKWVEDEWQARMEKAVRENRPFEPLELNIRCKDGMNRTVLASASSIGTELSNEHLVVLYDITDRISAEAQLRIAAIAFETDEAIMITDPQERILRVNKAFEMTTGYSADEVIGHTPHMLSSGKHDQAFYEAMWQQITHTGRWEGEIWDKRKNGELYPKWMTITMVRNEAGEVSHYVGISSDISQRKLAEEEIYSLAYYDTLTKLPNRRLLLDRFNLALAASERSGSYGVLLFLDLDKFKTLNDTLGHGYGDLLLIEVAARIKACVREIDTVARMGGDEFVILIENVAPDAEETSQKAAHVAEKVRIAVAQPYFLKGLEQHSSPSIGVCLYRGHAESVDDLLKHADLAMYQAKASGRNTVRFFDPLMQQAVEGRFALEADLRRAVPLEQLILHYQIQLDNERRPLGAEALLRWIHPARGMVSPAQFIPIAEESMLIVEIGHWVLESACRQLKLWERSALTRNLTLAINIGAQQFAMPDFVAQVAGVIGKHHVDPSRLKLELTESVVLGNVQGTVGVMRAFKELGVGLSMDDFGTGYSSLSYLKLLPLDQIKIDQSFVRDITTDPNDAILVRTIIDMAKNFRLNVIAEGVETEAQLEFLKLHGCMAYQGYYFSKPVPIGEFEALLS